MLLGCLPTSIELDPRRWVFRMRQLSRRTRLANVNCSLDLLMVMERE